MTRLKQTFCLPLNGYSPGKLQTFHFLQQHIMIVSMPDLSFINPTSIQLLIQGALTVTTVLFLVLFLETYIKYQHSIRNPHRIIEANQKKGYEIIHQAIKKAQDIISNAELEALKITTDTKARTRKTSNDYIDQLHSTSNQYQQTFATMINQAEQKVDQSELDFRTYLDRLIKHADEAVAANETIVKQRVNSLFEGFEQNLSSYLTETQQQSMKAIELEMQAARQLIDTYKQQQFKLIDENIVTMLEQTLSLVMIKKLSLKDHVDMVYESLEKAKAEKFII